MESLTVIFTITTLHLLAVISPGPDFLLAVRNSLIYSRKTGIFTAIGFGLGIAVHITYCLAGLAVIISQSIILFNIIKLLGAGYLVYIGIKSLIGRTKDIQIKSSGIKQEISPLTAIGMGFWTNVLNPKATLFFLGLFTLVVTPGTSSYILGISSVIMVVNTVLWFMLVALFFTQSRVVEFFNRWQGLFNKVFGGLLVALGLKVALSRN